MQNIYWGATTEKFLFLWLLAIEFFFLQQFWNAEVSLLC